MAPQYRRKNSVLLGWLRAAIVAAATYGALVGMQFSPSWGAAAFGLAAGVLAAISVELGVLTAIVAMTLPLAAANPIVGVLFVLVGIGGIRYTGSQEGSVFLLVAGAIAGAFLGPEWMIVPLAGYLLGAGEGALTAAIACLFLQAYGVVLGAEAVASQLTVHGGSTPLVSFAKMPESLFSTDWVTAATDSISNKSVGEVVTAFTQLSNPVALAVQPMLWALGAAVTAKLTEQSRKSRGRLLLVAAVAAGVLIPAAGAAFLKESVLAQVSSGQIAAASIGSLAIAGGLILLFEFVFPQEPVTRSASAKQPSSMSMEDADVDELLRLVATAEDRLANQHTTKKTVMITDMKAFSKMTEEDGSIVSAKMIQKHRDLLMPIIQRFGGHGKSTGGDGLIAAFDDERAAMAAATEMLRTLESHNRAHATDREIAVRIGIAEGEVVLDKGGRPFIGTALNMAARVMNLADGGQAYTTARVASKAGGTLPVHSHGMFELKNIAEPVEVFEIMWATGQSPMAPESSASAG